MNFSFFRILLTHDVINLYISFWLCSQPSFTLVCYRSTLQLSSSMAHVSTALRLYGSTSLRLYGSTLIPMPGNELQDI